MNNKYVQQYDFKKLSKEKLEEKLLFACKNGKVDLLDYLLTSPELNNKPSVHINNDECFLME